MGHELLATCENWHKLYELRVRRARLAPSCSTFTFAMSRPRRAQYLAVVRREQHAVFRFLQEQFETQGLVEVIWDRRVQRRRTAREPVTGERRRKERRRTPPATWDTLGFILVHRLND